MREGDQKWACEDVLTKNKAPTGTFLDCQGTQRAQTSANQVILPQIVIYTQI